MGTEGFQRASGKPFGRARRRETFRARKHAWHTLQKMLEQNALSTDERAVPLDSTSRAALSLFHQPI